MAEFFDPEKPFQSSSKTLALNERAISVVRSVDAESRMTISSANCTLDKVRARFASSFLVMMATESVCGGDNGVKGRPRSEEHTSELQSLRHLVCRLLL